MGYKNTAPEAFINYLAYDALDKKHFEKSKRLFELNIEWYPESSNVYDAYADYLLVKADTINAMVNYKKALHINNDSTIIKKINTVTTKKVTGISINDLQKYVGVYTLVDFQLDMSLEVRNGSLWAVVPGQVAEELQLISENVFTVKGKQGYMTHQKDLFQYNPMELLKPVLKIGNLNEIKKVRLERIYKQEPAKLRLYYDNI